VRGGSRKLAFADVGGGKEKNTAGESQKKGGESKRSLKSVPPGLRQPVSVAHPADSSAVKVRDLVRSLADVILRAGGEEEARGSRKGEQEGDRTEVVRFGTATRGTRLCRSR